MSIDSVLVAFLLAFFWTIFKVIEYYFSKKRNVRWGKEQDQRLIEIHSHLIAMEKAQNDFIENLSSIVEVVECRVKHLDEMHSVYDENLIPRWYLPSDMAKIIRQIQNNLEVTYKEMETGFREIGDDQSDLSGRMIDLITSQKIMVERLGDLIGKLNRLSDN
jgi:hypothetical protein